MLSLLDLFETWFVRFSLAFIIGNPLNLLLMGASGGQVITNVPQNASMEPTIIMAISGIALLLLLLRWQRPLYYIKSNPHSIFVFVFLLFVIASTIWSDLPDVTFRRSILVTAVAIFATYFSTCFSYKQQLQNLGWGLGITALLSLAFGLFLPTYGRMSLPPHTGSWRGVFLHKNALGAHMAQTGVFFLTLFFTDVYGKHKKIAVVLVAISLFLVVASRSSTGLVAFATMTVALFICNILRFRSTVIVPVLILIIFMWGGFTFYAQNNAEELAGVLGKDVGLTGRDAIWKAVGDMINLRPLLGYGYEAFWYSPYSASATVTRILGWAVPHSHNGLLELLLAVGWLGTIPYLLSFVFNIVKSIQLIQNNGTVEAIWPILFLLFMILSNSTEKNIMTAYVWSSYVWITLLPLNLKDVPFTTTQPAYSGLHLDEVQVDAFKAEGRGQKLDVLHSTKNRYR